MDHHDGDELDVDLEDASFDPEELDDEESDANPWAKTSSGDADDA